MNESQIRIATLTGLLIMRKAARKAYLDNDVPSLNTKLWDKTVELSDAVSKFSESMTEDEQVSASIYSEAKF